MKTMGIDFGMKRVGVALSDENASFAFPHSVMKNDVALLGNILSLAQSEKVSIIVIGESRDYTGKPNPIMEHITRFKEQLEKEGNRSVFLEPEFLTSAEAERIQGKTETLDASAAALILKSYLERYREK